MIEASDGSRDENDLPVICIAGMHRSGTSMVARLLSLCGVYLGSTENLSRSAPDNRGGFWENPDFVELNDNLLAIVHAGWDLPPAEVEWAPRPELSESLTKATQLIEHSAVHQRWGWKDPRNSLTFPFWLRLIPNLKVIICLRNPLEVARSLTVRNGTSLAFGLNLWRSYNLAVCSFASKQDRLVTHYEAYFSDPRGELRRVLDFLSIPASDKEIAQACLSATSDLRHHKISRELLAAQASPQIIGLYSELCAEAGPVFQASLRRMESHA
ncbi:MAG TPA: sulfotransferase [Pyrinomonadaceae bacterium]|nr:sulfotransferase [Pyrinomonadaceae bacterium]